MLATAGILGTMYALVASISAIPIQRAADALTPSVVRLYRKDRLLALILAILSLACVFTLLAGAPVLNLEPYQTLAAAVLALGVSLDLIRWYQRHIADLLDPRRAINKLVHLAIWFLHIQNRRARKAATIQRRLLRNSARNNVRLKTLEAIYHHRLGSLSAAALGFMTDIAEAGSRAITKRETHTAQHSAGSVAKVLLEYIHARRKNMLFLPSIQSGTILTTNDLHAFTTPSYELLLQLGKEAVDANIEAVVIHVINQFGAVALHTTKMPGQSPNSSSSPLSYAPIYYLREVARAALVNRLNTVGLRASEAVVAVVTGSRKNIDYVSVHSPSMDVLFEVVKSYLGQGYIELVNSVLKEWNTIVLDAVRRDHFQVRDILRDSAARFVFIVRSALTLEQTQAVMLPGLSLPPYDVSLQDSYAHLIQAALDVLLASRQASRGTYAWQALNELVQHAHEISRLNFGRSFLRWHVIETFGLALTSLISAITEFGQSRESRDLLQFVLQLLSSLANVTESSADIVSPQAEHGASTIAAVGILAYQTIFREPTVSAIDLVYRVANAEFRVARSSPWMVADILKRLDQIRQVSEHFQDRDTARKAAQLLASVGADFSLEVEQALQDRLRSWVEDQRMDIALATDPATRAYWQLMHS
jgi:hypothetical protein